jgi:hypothetical protein
VELAALCAPLCGTEGLEAVRMPPALATGGRVEKLLALARGAPHLNVDCMFSCLLVAAASVVVFPECRKARCELWRGVEMSASLLPTRQRCEERESQLV